MFAALRHMYDDVMMTAVRKKKEKRKTFGSIFFHQFNMFSKSFCLIILIISFCFTANAFNNNLVKSNVFSMKNLQMAEKNDFLDFISGKKAVEASKAAEPALYRTGLDKPRAIRKGKAPQLSEKAKKTMELWKLRGKGKIFDVTDDEAAFRFAFLNSIIGDEDLTIQAINNAPLVLTISEGRVIDNFDIYKEIYGLEKATGLIVRNPLILQVPTRGYGSAETSGDETIFMSYVVAATRPIGGPLLFLLGFLLAYKPLIGLAGIENPLPF